MKFLQYFTILALVGITTACPENPPEPTLPSGCDGDPSGTNCENFVVG